MLFLLSDHGSQATLSRETRKEVAEPSIVVYESSRCFCCDSFLFFNGSLARCVPESWTQGITPREALRPYLDSLSYRACFAAMFGDEAGMQLGYPPLGLPPWAGFEVASAITG